MYNIIQILFFISLFGTLASLCFGLGIYFKGGALYDRFGNSAMRWRVTFQGLTLFFFFLMLSCGR